MSLTSLTRTRTSMTSKVLKQSPAAPTWRMLDCAHNREGAQHAAVGTHRTSHWLEGVVLGAR